MNPTIRNTLRFDAIFDTSFGTLMLLAPWIRPLFEALDLPNPQPEVFTQFAGGLLLVCAYLLWVGSTNEVIAKPVALAVGAVNIAGVILVVGWMIFGTLGIGTLGTVILGLACAILLVLGVIELRYAL